jgi:hypothetical protein
MIRWLRVVVPLGWLATAAVLFFASEGLRVYLEWRFAKKLDDVIDFGLRIAAGAAFLFGVFRASAYNPFARTHYRIWLHTTPWRRGRRLPLGPIFLVAQDMVLLGVATALAWQVYGERALQIPVLFLFVYLFGIATTLRRAGERGLSYVVWAGLGGIAYFAPDWQAALPMAAAVYAPAAFGLWRALGTLGRDMTIETPPEKTATIGGEGFLGWPYDALGPKFSRCPRIEFFDAVCVSLLAGWLFFVAGSHFGADRIHVSILVLYAAGAIGPLVRLGFYTTGYKPPISLWGRLATGRLLIHGYDQALVAPLLAAAMTCMIPLLGLWGLQLDDRIVFPVTVTVVLFILTAMGPDLKKWRLTGNHRIEPAANKQIAIQVG